MTSINGDDDSYDWISKSISGHKIWRNADGQYHREGNLPAIIWLDGSVVYFRNGNRHRDGDLPACIWSDGTIEYWVNGLWQK